MSSLKKKTVIEGFRVDSNEYINSFVIDLHRILILSYLLTSTEKPPTPTLSWKLGRNMNQGAGNISPKLGNRLDRNSDKNARAFLCVSVCFDFFSICL